MENKVFFKAISWVIGIILIVIGWLFVEQTNTNRRIDAIESNFTEIKVDIGTIKNDINWIKKTMNKQNNITFK